MAIAITALTGCQFDRTAKDGTASPDSAYTDDLDRSVSLPDSIHDVLALAPNLTEIVYASGAGSMLAGAGASDTYPASVDTLPRFSAYPLDFEAVVALHPDLVFATDQVNNPQDAKTLSSLHIPTIFFSFNSVKDVFGTIRTIGDLLHTQPAADETADSLSASLKQLRRLTGRASNKPRVLFLIGARKLYFFGKGSYVHELVGAAGGKSVTSDLRRTSSELSEEYVLEANPDVIIGSFADSLDARALKKMHPTWKTVSALQSGRVYPIDGNLLLRPGPRIVKGAWQMARELHPQLLASSDSAAAVTRTP